jgi:hypothetical protein
MKPVIKINRDTLITVLLVVAGIVLALALFGAGVLWRSKVVPTKFTSWNTHSIEIRALAESLLVCRQFESCRKEARTKMPEYRHFSGRAAPKAAPAAPPILHSSCGPSAAFE